MSLGYRDIYLKSRAVIKDEIPLEYENDLNRFLNNTHAYVSYLERTIADLQHKLNQLEEL